MGQLSVEGDLSNQSGGEFVALPIRKDVQTSTLQQLMLETQKTFEEIDVGKVEALLSQIYRLQAKVIDPSDEDLFILWSEFKHEHNPLFAEATAILALKKAEQLGLSIGVIICVPSSATWMEESMRRWFPNAKILICSKKIADLAGVPHISLSSLTYTDRDANGQRMPTELYLEKPSSIGIENEGIVIVEDVIATGRTTEMHIEGLGNDLNIDPKKVLVVGTVSMDVQGGLGRIANTGAIAYAPVRVSGVEGVGMNKVKTIV